jgi:hypothetical protein
LNKHLRQQIWFKRWIAEGYTLRQLAVQSGHSSSTLRRLIEYWLARPPFTVSDLSEYRYLIFDGTTFEKRTGVFTVMDAQILRVLYGEYNICEGRLSDLHRFCCVLLEHQLSPKSATVDGNTHLIKALRSFWPDIIIQRCLVHIRRQGLSWCRRYPKRTDAKLLRQLFLQVTYIHTETERDRFIAQLNSWEKKYGSRIASSAKGGWVFSDLKQARNMLLSALPDMFHYIRDPAIVTSTNALEGYFGRLKQKYRQHRGLSKRHRFSYFAWYLHLCPR